MPAPSPAASSRKGFSHDAGGEGRGEGPQLLTGNAGDLGKAAEVVSALALSVQQCGGAEQH